jgi:hypothetical protein
MGALANIPGNGVAGNPRLPATPARLQDRESLDKIISA